MTNFLCNAFALYLVWAHCPRVMAWLFTALWLGALLEWLKENAP